jgi:hypothetical protein
VRAIALWFKDTPVGSPRQCTDFVGQWREELLASIWTGGLPNVTFGSNRVGFGMSAAGPVGGNPGNAGCPVLPFEGIGLDVIQTPKPEPRIMRYELTDFEWAAIRSFLPNKPRGIPDSNI